jgi:hypothetical protein
MNVIYQKYHITQPYDTIIIVKFINGYAFYFTETGELLDSTLEWSGILLGEIPPPDWDIQQSEE